MGVPVHAFMLSRFTAIVPKELVQLLAKRLNSEKKKHVFSQTRQMFLGYFLIGLVVFLVLRVHMLANEIKWIRRHIVTRSISVEREESLERCADKGVDESGLQKRLDRQGNQEEEEGEEEDRPPMSRGGAGFDIETSMMTALLQQTHMVNNFASSTPRTDRFSDAPIVELAAAGNRSEKTDKANIDEIEDDIEDDIEGEKPEEVVEGSESEVSEDMP